MANEQFNLLARWKLVKQASADRRLSAGDLAVLIAILDRINENTGTAWPGLTAIASDANIGRRAAVKSIGRLVELAYLNRQSGDRTSTNVYRMGGVLPAPRERKAPREPQATGVVVSSSPGVGACSSPKHTQENIPTEPAKNTADASRPAERFAEFYSVYPRKESKPQAEKAWKRLKLDGIADRIVADVLARMDNGGPWKGTEKRFILLPATYLNGQRWLDEWQTTTRSRVGTVAADSRTEAEVLAANEAALVRLGVGA